MNRRTVLAALGACALGMPWTALGQRQPKVWRVGILTGTAVSSPGSHWFWGAFLRGMSDLGYTEGKNIAIELRAAEGDYERLPRLAASLVASEVDVIVVAGAPTVAAAQKATTRIPIVIATAGDPVGSGFVKSLARPGGNITGLSDVASDMGFKLLDTLLSVAPGLTHVGVLLNPGNLSHVTFVRSIEEGARTTRVKILRLEAKSEREIDSAFSTMATEKVRGVIALPDSVFNARQHQIAELAAKHQLPCISGFRQYVHAGGLMNYGPDLADNPRRAAAYVDKIFKGAKPADLPVEQAARFELGVNLKTAKSLGLTIPTSVLIRADEVIK
jgi:putative ABC transport system substrate-binding protein